MPSNRLIKPFESFFVFVIFFFSTMFGLYFYWSIGVSQQLQVNGLADPNDPTSLGLVGALSGVLDLISWLSPFALVKGLLVVILPVDFYTFVNLFLLRPIGWIGAVFTGNYLISKIPTVSPE